MALAQYKMESKAVSTGIKAFRRSLRLEMGMWGKQCMPCYV